MLFANNKASETESNDKAVCLVSGGIDSPVAAWLMVRIGYVPVFIYFDNNPLSDATTERRAVESMTKVVGYWSGKTARVYVVPHGEDLIEIITKCPRKLTCILCRRTMLKVAELIAKAEGAQALVTGEILGEHASQTLQNLAVEGSAVSILILRPLIGMNKVEVEKIARGIGTFDISTKPASCCRAAPKQPRTKARVEEVSAAEDRLDVQMIVERAFKNARIATLGS